MKFTDNENGIHFLESEIEFNTKRHIPYGSMNTVHFKCYVCVENLRYTTTTTKEPYIYKPTIPYNQITEKYKKNY